MKNHIFAVVLSLFAVNACAQSEPIQRVTFPIADIQVADIKRQVQLADTPKLRALGLMFQQTAEPGMLLLYSEPRIISLWMLNTDLALDVAFIDQQWRIMTIKPLHPLDETSVLSPAAAIAALEMPRGWFSKNNIEVGHTLKIIR